LTRKIAQKVKLKWNPHASSRKRFMTHSNILFIDVEKNKGE